MSNKQTALELMDKTVKCLALELPEPVWKDVNTNWEQAKAALKEDGWIDEKPTEWKECILITASWWDDSTGWNYKVFEIKKWDCTDDNDQPSVALGIFQDGDEWGDIADLRADKYLILEPLKNK